MVVVHHLLTVWPDCQKCQHLRVVRELQFFLRFLPSLGKVLVLRLVARMAEVRLATEVVLEVFFVALGAVLRLRVSIKGVLVSVTQELVVRWLVILSEYGSLPPFEFLLCLLLVSIHLLRVLLILFLLFLSSLFVQVLQVLLCQGVPLLICFKSTICFL